MEYSQRIFEIMEAKGLTAYKVSKASGLSQGMFSNWKKKPTSKIPIANVNKIAEALKVSVNDITGTEAKKISPPSLEEAEEAYVRALIENGYIQKGKRLTKEEMERLRRAARIALED